MVTTSTIGTRDTPFSLAEMIDALNHTERQPVGFFVSQAIWDRLNERLPLATGRGDFVRGVKIHCDPDLPDAQFEMAFTHEAWRKRISEIKRIKL